MSLPHQHHHFLDLADLADGQLRQLLDAAAARKAARAGLPKGAVDEDAPLAGYLLAMVFEKPSTRTRLSFDMGMRQLGGQTVILNQSDMQLGRGESIADTAQVISRFADIAMLRTGPHETLSELAAHAHVPVINGLTAYSHPCQIVADLMTFEEHKGTWPGKNWHGSAMAIMSPCLLSMLPRKSILNWLWRHRMIFQSLTMRLRWHAIRVPKLPFAPVPRKRLKARRR